MKKKLYQQPVTTPLEVLPQFILCASSGYTDPDLPFGGNGSGFGGG